jgi:glycerophosphoryl diester phosphodiesterase
MPPVGLSSPIADAKAASPAGGPQISAPKEVISWRGMAQAYGSSGGSEETCTAQDIEPLRHAYIGNTIPSIQRAFELGATIVEIDVHRTTDGHLVLFHDWRLECRTNGEGQTNEQELAYLKGLDVGYGYTHDGGKTFPLRGTGVGLMPTLKEALDHFPKGRFLIDQKDNDPETAARIGDLLGAYPPKRRAGLFYWGDESKFAIVSSRAPGVRKLMLCRREAARCAKEFFENGGFPAGCEIAGLPIPLSYLPRVADLLREARARSHSVFYFDVNDAAEYKKAAATAEIDGIMTKKIDLLGLSAGK